MVGLWYGYFFFSLLSWQAFFLCYRNPVCPDGWVPNWLLWSKSLIQPLCSCCVSLLLLSLSVPATWPPPPSFSLSWLQWWVQNALVRAGFRQGNTQWWEVAGWHRQALAHVIWSGGKTLNKYICMWMLINSHILCAQFDLPKIIDGKSKRIKLMGIVDFAFWPK